MQVLVQRVRGASVRVDGEVTGSVELGLLALVGVGRHSSAQDAMWLAAKTQDLRVFADDEGRMNRSLREVAGGVLAISQFTLYGDVSRGRRPSFVAAAAPEDGRRLYDVYCDALEVPVARGVFGAHMEIDAQLDGPVTLLLQRPGSA